MLAVTFVFFARGWIGGGDAKLAAATALWLGFDYLMPYLLYASIFGVPALRPSAPWRGLIWLLLQVSLFVSASWMSREVSVMIFWFSHFISAHPSIRPRHFLP